MRSKRDCARSGKSSVKQTAENTPISNASLDFRAPKRQPYDRNRDVPSAGLWRIPIPRPLFLVCPFGCLQRVYLLGCFLDVHFEMGCRRTFSGSPFRGRIRIDTAVLAGRAVDYLAASIALFNNDMAASPIEPTSFLRHESAFDSRFYRLTNHLSLLFCPAQFGFLEFPSKKADPLSEPI